MCCNRAKTAVAMKCVAVCCNVLQDRAGGGAREDGMTSDYFGWLFLLCCSVLQCVAVGCSVVQFIAKSWRFLGMLPVQYLFGTHTGKEFCCDSPCPSSHHFRIVIMRNMQPWHTKYESRRLREWTRTSTVIKLGIRNPNNKKGKTDTTVLLDGLGQLNVSKSVVH